MNKKLPIFDFGSPFGYFVRPKPIESMLLFGTIFNIRKTHFVPNCIMPLTNTFLVFFFIVRVLDAVLLITDAAPNAIFRACKYTYKDDTPTLQFTNKELSNNNLL